VEFGKGETMFHVLNSMRRDEEGATMVEYGLLVALIAIVALVAVQTLGINLSTLFSTVANTI
jgi:pilus assembly protein Flp/PilA